MFLLGKYQVTPLKYIWLQISLVYFLVSRVRMLIAPEEEKFLIQRKPAKRSLLQFYFSQSWKRPSGSTAIHLFIKYFGAINAHPHRHLKILRFLTWPEVETLLSWFIRVHNMVLYHGEHNATTWTVWISVFAADAPLWVSAADHLHCLRTPAAATHH